MKIIGLRGEVLHRTQTGSRQLNALAVKGGGSRLCWPKEKSIKTKWELAAEKGDGVLPAEINENKGMKEDFSLPVLDGFYDSSVL